MLQPKRTAHREEVVELCATAESLKLQSVPDCPGNLF